MLHNYYKSQFRGALMSIQFRFKKSMLLILTSLSLSISGCSSDSVEQNSEVQNIAEPVSYLQRDVTDDVFYFVMPDRFYNADTSNDEGSKTVSISAGGFDPTSTGHYHGGDIKGLTAKLDYLQDMGITAIWLTPILRNIAVQGDSSGYHGYWPLDFTQIDPHLGTNDDLVELIDSAHEKNMKVFFDIITNHTADVIKFKECHDKLEVKFSTSNQLCEYKTLAQVKSGDKYTPYIPEHAKAVKFPAWLNDTKFYHNQGDSTWQGENSVYGDFMGLDDVDTDNPEVVQGMIDIFNNLITEFKPDGFRIDTVKHVNIEFWQQFTPAITEHAKSQGIPKFFVFGEVYDGNPEVLSYFTTVGKMPSVLDFAFQYRTKDVFAFEKGTNNLTDLFSKDELYLDEDSSANLLMNFVSNHDVGRLGYTLDQALPNATDEEKVKRAALSNALMYFARGIPVVYYGDEQGFTGDGGDRGAREDMMPSKTPSYNDNVLHGTTKTTADDNFDKTHVLYQKFADFAKVYQRYNALRNGEQAILSSSDDAGIFAFSRSIKDEKLIVVFNSALEARSYENDTLLSSQVVYGDGELEKNSVKLPGLSVSILKVN